MKDKESKLIHGDCIQEMQQLDEGSVDLTVTSPPYDNLRTYEGTLDWNEGIWKQVLEQLYRVTKQGGVVVWVVGDATVKGSETGTSFKQALYAKEIGFNLHDTMIWQKPNPIPRTHNRYEQAFEYVFVFSKGSPNAWNPHLEECKNAGKRITRGIQKSSDGRHTYNENVCKKYKTASNVWTVAPSILKGHPAAFPVDLIERHIKSWSNEGDTVLDPFMGSGTTGVAALDLNRNFIGIEKVEKYFQISSDRIAKNS